MATHYDGGESLLEETINHIGDIHSLVVDALPTDHPAIDHAISSHELGTAAWREHTLKGNMVGATMFLEDAVRAAKTAVTMFGQSRQAVTAPTTHQLLHQHLAQLVISQAKYKTMMGL